MCVYVLKTQWVDCRAYNANNLFCNVLEIQALFGIEGFHSIHKDNWPDVGEVFFLKHSYCGLKGMDYFPGDTFF